MTEIIRTKNEPAKDAEGFRLRAPKVVSKTVEGTFGPKKITREDFVKRWSGHFDQMFNLANTTAEYEEMKKMSERVRELAGASWDRIPA